MIHIFNTIGYLYIEFRIFKRSHNKQNLMQDLAFSSIEDLCQRVYEIQACISCAMNGLVNKQMINELNFKMSQLENSLNELEKFIYTLPDVNEMNSMAEEIRGIYEQCKKLQNGKEPIEATRIPKPIRTTKEKNHTHQPQQQQQQQSNENEIIQPITNHELMQASKSVNYRIPVEKINTCINELNEILNKKISIVKLAPNQVKASVRRFWERYKDEELQNDDRLFFTQEDIKETATLKNNSLKVLSVLQAIGRISCSTDSGLKRYFIK